MKSEAQPLRITAGAEPAKSWFVSWGLCRSPQTFHLGDRYFEVRDAEVHEKTPVRITSMDASFKGWRLKPSFNALAKWMKLPTEHLL
jgi:hypothetical protein